MNTLFDYIEWRGDLSFRQSGFTAVDNLILSTLAYVPYDTVVSGLIRKDGMTLSEAAAHILKKNTSKLRIRDGRDLELLKVCAASNRYSGIRLSGYVNRIDKKEEKQFSAISMDCPDIGWFVSFRGTDLTLVGWKEDFNMSFMSPVPSQVEAVEYLDQVASSFKGKLRVGGHSKGGNLAVYAAAFCKKSVQKRILAVFNNDGPGFDASLIAKDEYQHIQDRINSFIPQSSVIGMMLEHSEHFTVIESNQSGLLQHDPYSWSIKGTDFIRVDRVTNTSVFVDQTLKDWVKNIDAEQREKFIDSLYEIISATEVNDLSELSTNWLKHAKALALTLINTDEDTRKQVQETLSVLFKVAGKNLSVLFPGWQQKKEKKDE